MLLVPLATWHPSGAASGAADASGIDRAAPAAAGDPGDAMQ
jgi:hypothetical protein